MAKVCDLKRGAIVEINGSPHVLEDLSISTPSARGGSSLYRMRFRGLVSKQKVDKTCKGDESFPDVEVRRREVQFSYEAQGAYVFMDIEDYSEFRLMNEDIADEVPYITEDLEGVHALISDGRVLAIELPPVAELEVTETGPSMKGASATARTKPATLSTGLIVQVPEYLSTGEAVRVDTRTGKFLSRA
jgi:elongation factor P